ncbi:MAG: radical SAM protein [Desulfobacteraceae bacterium]|nr:radical SAM protein [Desulfobacteraceae bacterium]
MQLDICEIFFSLQGESTYTGLPCVFIRLSGCNLNCTYCDTLYAKTESSSQSLNDIIKEIEPYNCNLVEVTGGEPLLQANTEKLISKLIDSNYKVLLETNGSINIKNIHSKCIKIVDIKCPSSNESQSFLMENLKHLTFKDELKFVIGTRKDYEFAKSFIAREKFGVPPDKIHFSPVFDTIKPETIAGWIIDDKLAVRLSLQAHKVIWDKDKRGV